MDPFLTPVTLVHTQVCLVNYTQKGAFAFQSYSNESYFPLDGHGCYYYINIHFVPTEKETPTGQVVLEEM